MQDTEAKDSKVWSPAEGEERGPFLEPRDWKGCLEKSVTPTEGPGQPEASPGEVSLLSSSLSFRSASLGTEQDVGKWRADQSVDRIRPLCFRIDLLLSLLWCHCIYIKNS